MAVCLRALRGSLLTPAVRRSAASTQFLANARPVSGLAVASAQEGREHASFGRLAGVLALGGVLMGYTSMEAAKAEVSLHTADSCT